MTERVPVRRAAVVLPPCRAVAGRASKASPMPVLRRLATVGAVALVSLIDASCLLATIPNRDFRQDMRDFVIEIADTARARDSDFVVVPQNGLELFSDGTDASGPLSSAYADAVDGAGREDLTYGYPDDGDSTPAAVRGDWISYLSLAAGAGVTGLAIDYVTSDAQADAAYAAEAADGVLCFATNTRGLDAFPAYPATPPGDNSNNVFTLADARNFGYLIDPSAFSSKAAYLDALQRSHYDVLVIDLFWNGSEALTHDDVAALKTKPQDGTRLVLAYMSIGEAERYRWYWQDSWRPGSPSWLYAENPDWDGNYKVFYWDDEWRRIIDGGEGSYLDRILDAGFDGTYLDIIDAFEYFEERTD